jgi:hypothetical protein
MSVMNELVYVDSEAQCYFRMHSFLASLLSSEKQITSPASSPYSKWLEIDHYVYAFSFPSSFSTHIFPLLFPFV